MAALRARRGLVAVVVGLVAGTVAAATASAVTPVTADDAAAGSSPIGRCDPDGFTVGPVTSGADLVSVTVGDIAAGCATGDLTISLVDTDDAELGTAGPVPVPGGGDLTVPVAPAVAFADVAAYHVVVTGP